MMPRFIPVHVLGRPVVPSALLALAGLGLASLAAVAADTSSIRCPEAAQAAGGQAAAAPQGAAGMRVYVDPETGELTVPPADVRAAEAAAAAFSTSHEGLEATPSPVPGGGMKLDLKGRFRSPLVATIGADGKVSMQHAPCGRATQEGK